MKIKIQIIVLLISISCFSQEFSDDKVIHIRYEWKFENENDSTLTSKRLELPTKIKKLIYDDNGEVFLRTIERNTKHSLPIPGWAQEYYWIILSDSTVITKQFFYDQNYYPKKVKNRIGNGSSTDKIRRIYKTTSNGKANLVKIIYDQEIYHFEYDEDNQISKIIKYTSEMKMKKTYVYKNNLIQKVENPYRIVSEYFYDDAGKLKKKEEGNIIYKFTYDKMNNLTHEKEFLKSIQKLYTETVYEYNERGNLKSKIKYRYFRGGKRKILEKRKFYYEKNVG